MMIIRERFLEKPMNKKLLEMIPMVDFLAEAFGDDVEIALHDLTNLENSVVAIRNNHVSGRQVGAPATNFVLKIMHDGNHNNMNHLTNYLGISSTGRELRSSTYFIRDQGKLVGMLCVNIDYQKLYQAQAYLNDFLSFMQGPQQTNHLERFSQTSNEVTIDSIHEMIHSVGIDPSRMSADEKLEIVRVLYQNGIFLLKGAVVETALQLNVSDATIYRYLAKVKRKDERI